MMKAKYKLIFVASILVLAFVGLNKRLVAQTPPADPGVSWIMVTFNQAPTVYSVVKTPFRYNKTFAVSFHNDDGVSDIYTEGFPFFTGIQVGNSNYPGLFYTDGCGHDISFKLSSNLFSFNGVNGPDMHAPGNGYGVVSWPQLDIMYNNDCGIYNHGISGDASSGDAYMNYSIKRNESYIRRKLFETTPGGVQTRIFVNPNGNTAYSPVAFNLGYFTAFNQSSQGVIGNNGGDVNAYNNWLTPIDLYRLLGENTNVTQLADDMFANSINGANYWAPIFTHSIVTQYPLTKFHSDFNYIANTYGKDGLDNVWVATEEEILSYLRVKEATTITYGLAGNILLINLTGSIPSDMRFYPLSLLVNANATITNISFSGGINTFNGIGQNSSLINLAWDGRYIPDSVAVADSMVTIAEQTQAEYDCWIAMDYVYMVAPGSEHTLLRDRLCAINGITYDPGFCETCTFTLGADTAICQNDCINLTVPITGGTYLWSTGGTTQTITACPDATTTFWAQLTTTGGCIASDTILVNLLPLPVFDLGVDVSVCIGDTAILNGPANATYSYTWYADTVQLPDTTSQLEIIITDTTLIRLEVTTQDGCMAADSTTLNALLVPIVDLGADLPVCVGATATLYGPADTTYSYAWFADNMQLPDTTAQLEISITDTTLIILEVTTQEGCMAADTATLFALPLPAVDLGNDLQICIGSLAVLSVTNDTTYSYAWFADNMQLPDTTSQLEIIITDTTLIRLEVTTQAGCMASDTARVFALELPLITVTPAFTTLCFGNSVDLHFVTQYAIIFNWFNDSPTPNLTFTPALTDTTYYLWAVAENVYGCTSYDTAVVQVFSKPSFTLSLIGGANPTCENAPLTLKVHFQNSDTIQSLTWDTVTEQDITGLDHEYTFSLSQSTWFSVTSISNHGCQTADSIYFEVVPLPVMTISNDTSMCTGDTVTIEATGGQSCAWYVDGALISEANSLDVHPLATTTYTAEITGDGTIACLATDSVVITVHPKPTVVIAGVAAPDTIICSGSSLTLTASGAQTYLWSDQYTGAINVVAPLDSTHFSVIGTSEFGCNGSAQVQVNVFPYSIVSFSGLLPVYCLNDAPSQLIGIPSGGMFSGPGMVGDMFNPTLAFDGVHEIAYTITDAYNCTRSFSMVTRVFGGLTEINLGPDSTICPNDFVFLDAGIGFTEYYWSNGQTGQTAIVSGMDYPTGTTRYISVVGVLEGCTASGRMSLTIRNDCFIGVDEPTALSQLTILPNPNDGIFIVKPPKNIHPQRLSIVTVSGIVLFEQVFATGSPVQEEMKIQLPESFKGICVVSLQTDLEVYTSKLVVR